MTHAHGFPVHGWLPMVMPLDVAVMKIGYCLLLIECITSKDNVQSQRKFVRATARDRKSLPRSSTSGPKQWQCKRSRQITYTFFYNVRKLSDINENSYSLFKHYDRVKKIYMLTCTGLQQMAFYNDDNVVNRHPLGPSRPFGDQHVTCRLIAPCIYVVHTYMNIFVLLSVSQMGKVSSARFAAWVLLG